MLLTSKKAKVFLNNSPKNREGPSHFADSSDLVPNDFLSGLRNSTWNNSYRKEWQWQESSEVLQLVLSCCKNKENWKGEYSEREEGSVMGSVCLLVLIGKVYCSLHNILLKRKSKI